MLHTDVLYMGNKFYFRIAKQLAYTKTAISPVQMRIDIPGGLAYESFSSMGKECFCKNYKEILYVEPNSSSFTK